MEKLNQSNTGSLYGGKKIRKECEKLRNVIEIFGKEEVLQSPRYYPIVSYP